MRGLESARAICDCMAALVQGDLNHKQDASTSTATQVDNLLPLSPSGNPPTHRGNPPPHQGPAPFDAVRAVTDC